jgi:cytochrome c peroxidase
MSSKARDLFVSGSVVVGLAVAALATVSPMSSVHASQALSERSGVASVRAVELARNGEQLFDKETFGGDGRTCATCHRPEDGFSTTPASAQARFAADPNDPLFRPSDSDDGVGRQYTRLLAHATTRVRIPLTCRNIWLEDDPKAASIVVNRGIPGLLDTPALDPMLMSDGRAASLEEQASDAIHDHAETREVASPDALRQIATFEIGDRFFSSDVFRRFARRGPAPELPAGNTDQEKRGRVHFLPTGACGRCHSGPMLNTTSSTAVIGAGHRFANVRAGELVPSQRINPFVKWHLINNDGTERVFSDFADPGRILITCRREDLTNFKIRSLWNVKNTAPYFHDNSAKTLADVIAHYKEYLKFRNVPMTDQDLADILAYLKLL